MTPARQGLEATRAELAGAGEVNLIQGVLLVTDGTVTHLLEAYAGEPMRVVKLHQAIEPRSDRRSDADLDLEPGHDVLRREVLLQGAHSGRTFLYAVSRIVPGRLTAELRHGLLGSSKPIGFLLEESRTETFRQILTSWREAAGPLSRHFDIDPADEVIARTYRVLAGGRPIMLITEKFPARSFAIPPDEGSDGVLEVDGLPAKGRALGR